MNHTKAITLRIGYLRRRLSKTEYKYNKIYKSQLQGEIKEVQTRGVISLDKMFKKLHKMGYKYTEIKISAEGMYHVWGERSEKKIFGVLDPGGEAMMMLLPVKKMVTHLAFPSNKQYMTTQDTFLAALLHPENET